ncbi:hypothetical protein SEA_CIRCINUS_154 [Streptomyces phage Circinus]|uniref:Uncharacterized protein n=1 Tax=Streptomyces phage Circinus TaxID=2562189 RepID=A0A4D6E146_9CAUD|nr:hypothetical protein SEA_CIRCINUS_154 [Streptomyces phage Circinus]
MWGASPKLPTMENKMFWLSLAGLALIILLLGYFGRKSSEKQEQELARLRSLPNFNRFCVVVDKRGRELRCRVREWNIKPGYSRLWCIDPIQHPNGWTQSFVWPNEDIEFLEN